MSTFSKYQLWARAELQMHLAEPGQSDHAVDMITC